jgi:hypothetical protein
MASANRDGSDFLAFLKKAVKPHAEGDIHVVLHNLSTHTTPDVAAWLRDNPHVHLRCTPVGSSWINQIETWFGIITRQSIRRGIFSSVTVLIKQIRDYITRGGSSGPLRSRSTSHGRPPAPMTWPAGGTRGRDRRRCDC